MPTSTMRSTLLVAGASVLLAGCLTVRSELALSEDDTVSGHLVIALDASALEAMAESLDGAFDVEDDLSFDSPEADLGPGFDIEDLQEDVTDLNAELADFPSMSFEMVHSDNLLGTRLVFDDTPIEQLPAIFERIDSDGVDPMDTGGDPMGPGSDPSEGTPFQFTVDRVDDRHVFEGQIDLFGDDVPPIPLDFDIEVAMTFAGEVIEANGDIDGTTVTWTEEGTLSATAVAAPSAGGGLLLLAALAGGVIVLAVIVGLLIRSLLSRGKASPSSSFSIPQ